MFILQDKTGKKKQTNRTHPKENHATKGTKIPKTKRQKYGMNETLIIPKQEII